MSNSVSSEKLQQFEEFFSIEHHFTVNINPIENSENISFDQFLAKMPLPFKMASEIMTLDQAALRPIQGLSGVAGHLVEYLNHQAHKIDLLVGYVLSKEDEESLRYQGIKFGGGGIIINSDTPFSLQQILEMKLFFSEDNCAIYCYGEVIEIEKVANHYQQKITFHLLRDEDREILVRTSLHRQSKQLKTLAQQRNQDGKNN